LLPSKFPRISPELSVYRGFTRAVIVSVMAEKKGKQPEVGKEGRKPWTLREFGGKPVWDWLDLLLAPLVVDIVAAGLTAWFNAQQTARQNDIEDRRARAEQELAQQRAQDEALQAYLDQMSSLLLERNLRESEEDIEARTLARADANCAGKAGPKPQSSGHAVLSRSRADTGSRR
jgi:cell division protein FtsB